MASSVGLPASSAPQALSLPLSLGHGLSRPPSSQLLTRPPPLTAPPGFSMPPLHMSTLTLSGPATAMSQPLPPLQFGRFGSSEPTPMDADQPATAAPAALGLPGPGAAFDPAELAKIMSIHLVCLAETCLLKSDGSEWATLAELSDYVNRREALTVNLKGAGVLHPKGGASAASGAAAHLKPRGGVSKRSGGHGGAAASAARPGATSAPSARGGLTVWGTTPEEHTRRCDSDGCLFCGLSSHRWGPECPDHAAGLRGGPSSSGNVPRGPLHDPGAGPGRGGRGGAAGGRGGSGRGHGRGRGSGS